MAASRVAVGTDWTCTQAGALSRAEHAGSHLTVAMAYDNATNTAVVGHLLTVTVRLRSLTPHVVPLPDNGVIGEVAAQRLCNIPVDAAGVLS